jgi:hypothetical protein
MSVEIRFSQEFPCLVCEGGKNDPRGEGIRCSGFLTDQGIIFCSREEYGEGCRETNGGLYAHTATGQCGCGQDHDETKFREYVSQQDSVNPNGHSKRGRSNGFSNHGAVEHVFTYQDENGKTIYEVVRFEDKHHSFRHPCPDRQGDYVYTLGGTKDCECTKIDRILYQYPSLINAPSDSPIFIPEGEKHTDRLRENDQESTTFAQGAGNSHLTHDVSVLKDHFIVILPDNDEPGLDHAYDIAMRLSRITTRIKILELPGLPPKGDIIDWLDHDHTINELTDLVDDCPWWSKWQEPLPLDSPPVPEFPVDLLPAKVARLIREEAEAKQVPPELVANLILGAVAAATAKKYEIWINSSWWEPLNIFVVLVLPSGERKSAVFRVIFEPVHNFEDELMRNQAVELTQLGVERDILEARLKQAKSDAAKSDVAKTKSPKQLPPAANNEEASTALNDEEASPASNNEEAPLPPEQLVHTLAQGLAKFEIAAPVQLLGDDCTSEAVTTLLVEQGGRIAITSTEGGIFDIMGGLYSGGMPKLDVYLKGYSGDTLKTNRVGRPREKVHKPALTMVLTVQPDVVAGLSEHKAFRGRGLLSRPLYAVPPSKVGHRRINTEPTSQEALDQWNLMVRRLLEIPLPEGSTPQITLSDEATSLFVRFQREVEDSLAAHGELGWLQDWGAKLAGNVARLAGLLELIIWAEETNSDGTLPPPPADFQIDGSTMSSAISLGFYFAGHAAAAFALMGTDTKASTAQQLWEFIEHHYPGGFVESDLWRKVRNPFGRRKATFDETLGVLTAANYVCPADPPAKSGKRGRPTATFYEVNPAVIR